MAHFQFLHGVCNMLLLHRDSRECCDDLQHVQVERGKQSHYCFDEQDLKSLLKGYPANASYHIQRFKGLIHLLHLSFEHK
jgi:hypothetical protein